MMNIDVFILHGKIDLSKLCDKKASILVSAEGMNYREYAKAVDNIRKTNSVNIVFFNV